MILGDIPCLAIILLRKRELVALSNRVVVLCVLCVLCLVLMLPSIVCDINISWSYLLFVDYLCDSSLVIESNHLSHNGPRAQSVTCLATRESDCRSRDLEFDPGPVTYFRGD